jgi:CDP-paratose 2-epimerase
MRKLLVTGGAGFIGCNTVLHFARKGWHVTVLDNLSRHGTPENLRWLQGEVSIEMVRADVRDAAAVATTIEREAFDAIIHLAGQVAVTTSVTNPREDFEVNALGTFNVLEAARRHCPASPFVYASTNKVYGKMDDVPVVERGGRYAYESIAGATEHQQLDFHSPYGCSKGAADQYVVDYHRIYGLPSVAFRQSCIYGPRQFGVEDQGWVAWFIIAATLGKDITIYGDGKQVRDVLHVGDLVRLYEMAIDRIDLVQGEAFNIGGGPDNVLSLLELIAMLERKMGTKIPLKFADWRPGDQPVFVCDLGKVRSRLGWSPEISADGGVDRLIEWVRENKALFG